MKVFVIIPAYNESVVISSVIHQLKNKADNIIVIDDGSIDATSDNAKNAGAVVLRHFLNRGQGAALQTGIDYALQQDADIIVTFDADGQHDAEDVENLVEPIKKGEVDVVLGSGFVRGRDEGMKGGREGIPISRLLLLKLAILFTRFTAGLKVTDVTCGLRAFSRVAAQKIQIRQDGMAHASEILEEISRHNLAFKEVSVTIRYTEYSKQKGQRASNSFKIIWDLFIGKISR